MSQTKKLTLSSMIVAMSALFLVLGSVIEVLDLSACALSSLFVVFVYIEVGKPYHFLVWLATSLTTALLYFGKPVWLMYLFVFGIYPILKAYIERLPRGFWIVLKLVYVNIILVIFTFLFELIFKTPLVPINKLWIKIGVYVLLNAMFIIYDIFITVMIRFYFDRLRNRIKHLLK